MNDDSFLDTNILVYAFDPANPRKRETARTL
ncbi:MAG: PIN domain-containing protein, partial [Verrucomicrobia bacterium]|nr:PIN domain-containing protein [Verrucomicrobiota bacterium]